MNMLHLQISTAFSKLVRNSIRNLFPWGLEFTCAENAHKLYITRISAITCATACLHNWWTVSSFMITPSGHQWNDISKNILLIKLDKLTLDEIGSEATTSLFIGFGMKTYHLKKNVNSNLMRSRQLTSHCI